MLTNGQLLAPRKGAIAIDSNGCIGLILSEDDQRWDHTSTGEQVFGWDGIHLTPEALGERWFCSKPKVIGYADSIFEILANSVTGNQVMGEALDATWEAIYPDAGENGSWEYPGQVAAHVKAVLEELHYAPRKAKQVEAGPDTPERATFEGTDEASEATG